LLLLWSYGENKELSFGFRQRLEPFGNLPSRQRRAKAIRRAQGEIGHVGSAPQHHLRSRRAQNLLRLVRRGQEGVSDDAVAVIIPVIGTGENAVMRMGEQIGSEIDRR